MSLIGQLVNRQIGELILIFILIGQLVNRQIGELILIFILIGQLVNRQIGELSKISQIDINGSDDKIKYNQGESHFNKIPERDRLFIFFGNVSDY